MVFSSLLFLFRFLPFVLLAYYIVPQKFRNAVLFFSSLVFYAWGEPIYILLILFSTVLDYCMGQVVAVNREKGNKKGAIAGVTISAIVNLSLLGFFKYAGFFLQIIHTVTGISVPEVHIALPIGISFYTFQTMSYTIDIYRGDAKVQKDFVSFGAYVSLFPQLIAGPIIRYKDIDTQLRKRKENVSDFSNGILRFMTGLGKKVLIANQVGELWKEIAATPASQLTTAMAWLGVLAFTLQIYFDFSGYSDMAIGLGAMFGFSFPENFHYPYESKSITEFWRRWHISLGTWFREYVYIPLGGNRVGKSRQFFNIAVVWLLTGLWHGAYLNFVLWGVFYGVLLVIEKSLWKPLLSKLPRIMQHMYTMIFVMIGWAIFSWQDMADGVSYFKAMFFDGAGMIDRKTFYYLASDGILLVVGMIGSLSVVKRMVQRILPDNTVLREIGNLIFVIIIFITCVAMLVNSSYNPFLYFRF